MFKVYIVEAENLPAADVNGKSDPYVKAFCAFYGQMIKFAKTSIIKKTLNPVWDKGLAKPFLPPFFASNINQIEFRIFDKDILSKDDFLGDSVLSPSKMVFGAPIVLPVRCKKADATITVFLETSFNNISPGPFKISSITHLYCYLTYEKTFVNEVNDIFPEIKFYQSNQKGNSNNVDCNSDLENIVKESNSTDVLFFMEPIKGNITNSGPSLLFNFNISESKNLANTILVPLLESNGFAGRVFLNFAFFSLKKDEIDENFSIDSNKGKKSSSNNASSLYKPLLVSQFSIDVNREKILSFPVSVTFTPEKNILFHTLTPVTTNELKNEGLFYQKVRHLILPNSIEKVAIEKKKPFSLVEAAKNYKRPNPPSSIIVNITLNTETDHQISAAAFSKSFDVLGRISVIANHTCLDDNLMYDESNTKNLIINLSKLDESVSFILVVFTSPSFDNNLLDGKRITVHVYDKEDNFEIMSNHPTEEEKQPAWMPFILHRNKDNVFDILNASTFFNSKKPFDAQSRMKSLIKDNNIIQSYY